LISLISLHFSLVNLDIPTLHLWNQDNISNHHCHLLSPCNAFTSWHSVTKFSYHQTPFHRFIFCYLLLQAQGLCFHFCQVVTPFSHFLLLLLGFLSFNSRTTESYQYESFEWESRTESQWRTIHTGKISLVWIKMWRKTPPCRDQCLQGMLQRRRICWRITQCWGCLQERRRYSMMNQLRSKH